MPKKMALFFYALIAVPLVYVPDISMRTRSFRFLLLLGILLISLGFYNVRQSFVQNITRLPLSLKFALGFITLALLISSFPPRNGFDTALFGIDPEYLGLVSWLTFFGLGILFRKHTVSLILNRVTAYIFGVILCISLLMDKYYIQNGFRVSGLLNQPTAMGIYAVIAAILWLNQLVQARKNKQKIIAGSFFSLSILVTLLSQSRVSFMILFIILSVWTLGYIKTKPLLASGLFTICILLCLIPQFSKTYFARFHHDSVGFGVQYRWQIYQTSGEDLLKHNVFRGNGPSTLPKAINNQNTAPEEIADTLRQGYSFLSAHDLFFDFAYVSGCLSAFSLLGIFIYAGYLFIRSQDLVLISVWLALFANALVNVPGLELTSLTFVLVFSEYKGSTKGAETK